jgi:hypothetical protein
MAGRRVLGIVCRGLACALATAFATAPAAAQAADADTAVMKHIRNIAGGTTNQVATQMFAAGVRNCAARIDQVANFLTKGTQSSALLFLPERETDNSMVSVSAEVQAEGFPRAYASATFSPNTAIGCATVYETVQYWTESCNIVAAKYFKGSPPSGPLGAEIGILTIGPLARVFLLRATSTSCVTIKKEVLR